MIHCFSQKSAENHDADKVAINPMLSSFHLSLFAYLLIILSFHTSCQLIAPPIDQENVNISQLQPLPIDLQSTLSTKENRQAKGNQQSKPSKKRVISLAPSYSTWVYALGGEELLVARTDFCDDPPEVKSLPSVGQLFPPSLEKILAFFPTDILMIEGHTELSEQLKKRGIKVHYFPQNTKEELLTMIKQLSMLLGKEEKGELLIQAFEKNMVQLKAQLKGKAKGLLFEIWMEPLTIAGEKSFIGQLAQELNIRLISLGSEPWHNASQEALAMQEIDIVMCSTAAFCEQIKKSPSQIPWKKAPRLIIESNQRFVRPTLKILEDFQWLIDQIKLNFPETP